MNDIPSDLIGLGKAGRLLGVNPCTIKRWLSAGRLPGWRVAGRYRVRAADVRAMLRPVDPPPSTPAAEATRRQRDMATAAKLARHGL